MHRGYRYVGASGIRKAIMSKPIVFIAILVFFSMAFLHLLRLLFGWSIMIEGTEIAMWVSVVGCLVPGGLAIMLWREGFAKKK